MIFANFRFSPIFSIVLFLIPSLGWSYPDFISYGYKSCLTCHYNGQGSGPLNDYGRALFASEFTAQTFTKKSPDQLADESGFLGSAELPWWFRAGIKYRGLHLQTRTESRTGEIDNGTRWINMQGDLDLIFNFDKKSDLIFVLNYAYIPPPFGGTNSSGPKPANAISKQHYLRWKAQKGLMIYAGLMDKIFGIRHPDHTAVNRAALGLGQNDQAHGLSLQYSAENYEVAGGWFTGNLNQDKELRQAGASVMAEYYLKKTFTIGASLLKSENDFKREERAAVHSRLGFTKGKSIMLELGVYDNNSKTSVSKDNKGLYTYMQGLIGLEKGYNFLTTYQMQKPDRSSTSGTELSRYGLGFLVFPWQRTEFRFELVNSRSVMEGSTGADSWATQSQVHVAW